MTWLKMNRLHRYLFGHDISVVMQKFVGNLSLSATGYIVANSLLFLAVVLAGRLLGPFEFGQYALVMAVAQILIIAMIPGVDVAVMRELALGQRAREKVLASGMAFVAMTATIVSLVALLSARWVSEAFGVPLLVWRVSVVVALGMGLKAFFDGVVRGLEAFRFQLGVRVLDGLAVLVVFLGGYAIWIERDFRLLPFGIVVGAFLSSGFVYRRYILGKVDFFSARFGLIYTLWRYGRSGVIGALAGMLLVGADKLLLGRSLGTHSLGVYQAYYFASVQLTGQLAQIFLNVFFPAVIRQRSLTVVLKKIDRLMILGFAPSVVLVAVFLQSSLWLFSAQYAQDIWLTVAMSFYAVLWFAFMSYWTLISSTGPGGILYASSNALVAGVLHLAVAYSLVDSLNLFAPPIAFLLAFVYMAGVVVLWRVRFRHTLH